MKYMENLAQGQNSMCDLSGLTKGDYKGLLRESCSQSTHTRLYAGPSAFLLQSLMRVALKDSGSLTSFALMTIAFLAQEPLLRSFLTGGPSAKASLRCFCQAHLEDIFLSIKRFPTLALLPFSLLNHWVHKTAGAFCLGLPQQ